MRTKRAVIAAALALGATALHAVPASAARIPLPRLDTGRTVQLQIAERATTALPADTASRGTLRAALDDARARTHARLDTVADAATAQSALRDRLRACLAGARDAAVEQWLQSLAAGTPSDFNALVHGGAVSCFSSQFPQAVGARIDEFAEAAAGHANEVAYDELAGSGETTAASSYPDDAPYGGYETGGGGGGATVLGIGALGLLAGAVAVVLLTRRRSG